MRHTSAWHQLIFGAALCLLVQSIAWSTEQTAKLSIAANSLVFSGPGLFPPDEAGHFAIGIQLPQPNLETSHCEGPNLILGVGTLNKPPSEFTEADKQVISRNMRYYQQLMTTAKTTDKVIIPVRNKSQYLRINKATLSAPYCILSIDEDKLP